MNAYIYIIYIFSQCDLKGLAFAFAPCARPRRIAHNIQYSQISCDLLQMIIWWFLGKFGCFVCCALCAEGERKGQKQRPSLSSHGGKICRYRCPCLHSLTRKKNPHCILNRRLTCDKKLFSTFFYVHKNLRNAITTREMQFKRVRCSSKLLYCKLCIGITAH